MGAKIAAAPRNTQGLVYLSWKDGKGAMIRLWKDPDTQTYGLQRQPNGEFWLPISAEIKPKPIREHGTMVTATELDDMRFMFDKQLFTFRSGNPGAGLSLRGSLVCLWLRTSENAPRPELGCQAFGRVDLADSEIGPT